MSNVDKLFADIKVYNKDVSNWAYRVRGMLKAAVQSKLTKGEGTLASLLKASTRKDFGEIDMISYKFPRHGVFAQKGVGRGHTMQGGKVVRGIKDGKVVRFEAKANSRGGVKAFSPEGVSRDAVDWFNGTLDKEVPVLADIVADHKADEMVVNAVGMRIG